MILRTRELAGLGQWDFASAIVNAAGTVGSTFITADATKYAAKTTAKAALEETLAQTQAQLAAQKAQLEAAKVMAAQDAQQSAATTQTVQQVFDTGTVALVVLGLGAGLLWVASRRHKGRYEDEE